MSNKVLCTCGKEHACNRPLVITIKTCPNNKHKSSVSTKHPGDESVPSPSVVKVPEKQKDTKSQDLESDHILICEDGGVTIPTMNAEKPLIDNSIHCDLDNTTAPTKEKKPTANGKPRKGLTEKTTGTDAEKARRVSLNSAASDPGFERSKRKRSTDQVSVNPQRSRRSIDKSDTSDKATETTTKGPTEKREPEIDQLFFDPSYDFTQDEEDFTHSAPMIKDKKEDADLSKKKSDFSKLLVCSRKRNPPDSRARNVGNNYPAGNQLRLPILTPRYHGPGCAMEVNVLERHDPSCRYRKEKNANRCPTDDRSGSYDVIGRLMYKTCNPEFSVNQTCCRRCPANVRVANLYSLLTMPRFNEIKEMTVRSNYNRQELERYLRRKRILEDLARNTKSFPNQANYVQERKKCIQIEEESKNSPVCKQNLTSYEVEVLYFYQSKCDKSIQFSKPRSTVAIKRWFYFILPCVTMEKSETALVNDY